MQSKVFIITGKKNAGKTTLLGNVVRLLQERELETRGFLAEVVSQHPECPEYYLTNISTGNQQLLCSKNAYPGWMKAGSFYFNPVIVDLGNKLLLEATLLLPDFYIIDEVSKLETQGLIWDEVIVALLKRGNSKLLWTTREDFLNDVLKHYQLMNFRIFEAGEANALEIVQSILQ